jgi:hypothetical protein
LYSGELERLGIEAQHARGAEVQTIPLPSTSIVTAPPSGIMPSGVGYMSILPVRGLILPKLFFARLALNQRLPSPSRVRPCALAARPLPSPFGTLW